MALNGDQQRWLAIFNSGLLGVAVRDADACIVECNERFAEIFASTPAAMLGSEITAVLAPHETVNSMASETRRIGARASVGDERTVMLLDGREIQIRTSVFALGDIAEPARQIVVIDDVTGQRQVERELAQTRRSESTARLAGGVAHELNNKLAVILGYTSLISSALGRAHPQRSELVKVQEAAEHSAALTRALLAFGGRQVLDPCPLEISQVIADMLPLVRVALGERIHLVVEDRSDGALVFGDQAQIEQVLVSLVLNGCEAMPDGGVMTLLAESIGESIPGRSRLARVAVADSGHGMTEEVLQRIFEPFFTTKDASLGAGLGLSAALGIIEQSGGSMYAESEAGEGSTVSFELPVVEAGSTTGS